MNTNAANYAEILEQVASTTIAQNAAQVDQEGAFPEGSIAALREAGLLGAVSATEVGGLGLGMEGASRIVRRIAEECGSTAMVVTMHFCGAAVLEAYGSMEVRRAAASGEHLSTLAFSEVGSRSHFWAPNGTAETKNGHIVLNASKSWVTSASRAAAYVWSSKPVAAEGFSTLWLVPASSAGIGVKGPFHGMGLRGNDSSPVGAEGVAVEPGARLGEDGKGFDIMMGVVLPLFNVLIASCSNGLMGGAVRRTVAHAAAVRHSDTGSSLGELPTIRNYIARMRVKASMADALLQDTIAALGAQRADGMLRVLECKAASGETSNEVLDIAMRVCGGAAFRKEVGVERLFRDARAAGVMSPTTDQLYDFIGKAVCGMPLF